MITHASTFSGIGAPEVAAEMLGWENVFHCEINPFGRKVLDYYFPKAKSYEDITKTDFSEWRDKVTVLTGGFPCQPFSYAGKRRGTEDDRYLWPFMLRCIEQVRPRWFVGENVAGITTMEFPNSPIAVGEEADLFGDNKTIYELRQQLVLSEIIESLVGVGYSVQPFIIPACSVNAPHRRDRVFIVAHRLTEDSMHSGLMGREHDEQGCERNIGNAGARGAERVCEQTMGGACTYYTRSQRRREIYGGIDGGLSADSRLVDVERPSIDGSNGTNGRISSRKFADACGEDYAEKLDPFNRWRTFPSVSPVYRGNDGLPFPVDHLTIPFSEWKRESLKAYGNAIVPQVMYEIFRCIDEIEKTLNPE